MKIINDAEIVRRELERRGEWESIASSTHHNHTVLQQRDVFRCQKGHSDPSMNYLVWVEFDEGEDEQYDLFVGRLAANALGLDVCMEPVANRPWHNN